MDWGLHNDVCGYYMCVLYTIVMLQNADDGRAILLLVVLFVFFLCLFFFFGLAIVA